MKWHVLDAVFKRNFTAYFSNPTGYVFICVFVLLGSLAAFWPPEFFNANLANLDQLNRYLPFILLVFVPAITMSVWADERRQGTDELLLTLPASDWEVVFGKYLAAVGIFTVALLFSCVCNAVILSLWGSPDVGLFLANYLGYWFTGLAMLAVGMVASFLTSNLTVGFILGLLFNAPLAVADQASAVMGRGLAEKVKSWGLAEHFSDFGRGIVSVSSVAYFLGIVAVCLYLAMVLIGRRHWTGRRDGGRMGLHYLARTLGLVAAAVGCVLFFRALDLRADLSAEQISSLSPETRRLLRTLESSRPIDIKAYVSPTVPEDYTQTRLNLLNTLRQFQQLGRGKVNVEVIPTEPKTDAAAVASQQFGIEPQRVVSQVRGTYRNDEEIFLGCAFVSGLEKVVVPFFDKGTPVEYELIRSVWTAAQQKRKRLGVLTTDADLFGGFDMMTGQPRPRQPIVDELEKQYEVIQVDASAPITESFDVLLAVQPSSLGPEQMAHFVAAVKAGQPVAIFEDPLPVMMQGVPGTAAPRRNPMGPMGAMFGGPQGQPKGDLGALWQALGVQLAAGIGRPAMGQMGGSPYIVYQAYNPHPKLQLPDEFVFIDASLGGADGKGMGFNQEQPITSGLQEVLFPFPGSLTRDASADVTWTPLARTSQRSGTIATDKVEQVMRQGNMALMRAFETPGDESLLLAVAVERKPQASGADAAAAKPIRAVVVADIDLLSGVFFGLRNRRDDMLGFDFDNVTFALNVIDSLAGDERFIDIRKRKPKHRTLERIEDAVAAARDTAETGRARFNEDFEKAEREANTAMQAKVGEFEAKIRALEAQGESVDQQAALQAIQQLATQQRLEQRKLDTKIERLKRTRDAEVDAVERTLESQVRREQDRQKWLAVLLPPIPPLVLAFFVFFRRRALEREGVAKSRLR